MKGTLQSHPLPLLIADLTRSGRSGILTITRGQIKKQACLLRGMLRFAASNVKAERLGEYLLREGIISPEELRRAEAMLSETQRLGGALVDAGALTMEQLRQVVRAHILDILLPCFDWPDGQFSFADGVPNIAGEVHVEIPALELSLERARRRENKTLLSRLSSSPETRLSRMGEAPASDAGLELRPLESDVLRHVEGSIEGITVEDLLTLVKQDDATVLRCVHDLIEAGVLRATFTAGARRAGPGPVGLRGAAGESSVAMASNEERMIRHYLDRYRKSKGADYYELLEVSRLAKAEDIRRAYYVLAKELHPDRFASPPLNTIRTDMEELFSRISEAYNVLADSSSRGEYDRQLQPDTATVSAPSPLTSEATKSPKDLARLNYVRGRTLADQGKLAEARTFLLNAVSLDSTRPEYLYLLGSVQARHPRYRKEALENLIAAESLDPTRPEVHVELGRLHERLGNLAEAERQFREALRWDPNNAEARQALQSSGGAGFRRGLFGKGSQE